MNRIKQLRDRKAALITEADALAAKDADGSITEEESARYGEILDKDLKAVNASIDREERLMEERRTMAAATVVEEETDETPRVPAAARSQPERFSSFGEQLQAVAAAGMNRGGDRDRRLEWQAASGANESVPSEGGFLVQTDYSTVMMELMHDLGDIVSRVRRIPISVNSNGIHLPAIDETSRANGSRFGGVQAYWADEAETVTASKPKYREMELRLRKLMAIGYATDELLADASALEAVMRQAFVEELTFKTEDAIINGTGAGQPLGVLNSGALVTVTPNSGAGQLQTEDVTNMWGRLPIRARRSAIWVINQEVEPALYHLTIGEGTAVKLLYRPPGLDGANANTPFGTLLGRPVIPIEYAAALGTVGDILLFDPMNYVMIDKNGVQQASSMHVRFLNDEMTFRFTYRVDGQPVWKQPVTPYKGTNDLSPFVALGSR